MTESNGTPDPSRRRRVVVRLHGQELVLPDGRSVVGRSDACRIVLSGERVSRRHARIDVHGEEAELVDLDSANGVLLNGREVGRVAQPLRHGDVLTIGGHSLLIQLREEAGTSEAEPGSPVELRRAEQLALEPEPLSRGVRPTRVSGTTDLVLKVCEHALDAGQISDAERVLRGQLSSMVRDAQQGRRLPAVKRNQAIALALRLAQETRSGEWFDRVVALLSADQVVCSPETVRKLRLALDKVDSVDVAELRAYLEGVRSLPSSMETIRAAHEVDQLLEAAVERNRIHSRRVRDDARRPPGSDGGGSSSGSGIA